MLVLQPTFLLLMLLGLAIANLWRGRYERRRRLVWVTIPYLLLCLSCTRAAGTLAHMALEWPYPPSDAVPGDAQAIVVLSGYVRGANEMVARAELGMDSIYRCLQAVKLHRTAESLPILVSGGRIGADPDEPAAAWLMRDFLIEKGVAPSNLIVEDHSANTRQNSVRSSALLRERDIRHVVLVTDGEHMLRAAGCFRNQGFRVTASPARPWVPLEGVPGDFLPNPRESTDFELAVLEYEKIIYYWIRGWL
ncbi:YdcF family protein (plasmid) [Tundrisphaera lichenicola]|uniref:YdcF family protein n=1 Tax=Tundrisphaera lichenicola TaxID=2029860 RepID=UPI003EC0BA9E